MMDAAPAGEARSADASGPEILPFQPLGDYAWPSAPAEEAARRLLRRLRKTFARGDEPPTMARDRLQRATLEKLDEVVAPPASGPLVRELGLTVADWIADPAPKSWLRLVVLPPCDDTRLVETWARDNGHQVLLPPDRAALTGGAPPRLPDLPGLDGQGVLVIPQLERWFVRHRNGLSHVRALLAGLDRLQRHCLIGCNSWAWAFLSKAANADAILPTGLTFQAFDAQRLQRWFTQLAQGDAATDVTFRLSGSGEDVLETDEDGALKSDFFKKLAARSLGIPWVAWYLWRTGLRSEQEPDERDPDAETAAGSDDLTLWIAPFQEFTLPPQREQLSLLILQALLLHGPMTQEEMGHVLPATSDLSVLPALVRADFIARRRAEEGDQFSCRAAAYPAIRSELSGAGYPMDRL